MKIRFYLLLALSVFMTSNCMAMLPSGSGQQNQENNQNSQISPKVAEYIKNNPKVVIIIENFKQERKDLGYTGRIFSNPTLTKLVLDYYDIIRADQSVSGAKLLDLFHKETGISPGTFKSVIAKFKQRQQYSLNKQEKEEVATDAVKLLQAMIVNGGKSITLKELVSRIENTADSFFKSKIKTFCKNNRNDFSNLIYPRLVKYNKVNNDRQNQLDACLMLNQLNDFDEQDDGEDSGEDIDDGETVTTTLLQEQLNDFFKKDRRDGDGDGDHGGGFGAMPLMVGE